MRYNEVYHDCRIAHARADRLRRRLTDDPEPPNHLARRTARAEEQELREWERYGAHLDETVRNACKAASEDEDLRLRPWRFRRERVVP